MAATFCYHDSPMISLLRGMVRRGAPGELTIDVHGVGYGVAVPLDVWEQTEDGKEQELTIVTFVREDRLELFGFSDAATKALFQAALALPGIGPRLALELCSVPRHLLRTAIDQQETHLLTTIKGVGKKTAEKLLLDLKSLFERRPEIFHTATGAPSTPHDQDALDALTALGYDTATALHALRELPAEFTTAQERVTAVLRSL